MGPTDSLDEMAKKNISAPTLVIQLVPLVIQLSLLTFTYLIIFSIFKHYNVY
jgi:hypothetical protein